MSLATIEVVEEILPHPNPEVERLEIVRVVNYQCLVSKGTYQVGDEVILILPDTVLPDASWSEVYKKFSKNRVKAQRFKGFWSYGIVESVRLLPSGAHEVGQEVSDILGITKYEAPVNNSAGPNNLKSRGGLPYSIPKTDETNWEGIRGISNLWGTKVDITLKVDGQNVNFYYKDGNFGVTSRGMNLDVEGDNKYTSHIARYDIYNKLSTYCETHKVNLCLRGESYGVGIQNFKCNSHSKLPLGAAFYSVYNIDECRYEGKGSKHYFIPLCKELGLPIVDILEEDVELSYELIQKYSSQLESLNGQPFEGVVIKGTDFSFKVINRYYDSKK